MAKEKRNRAPVLGSIPRPSESTPRAGEERLTKVAQRNIEGFKERNVIFSWQFFDRSNPLFNCGEVGPEWFVDLMDSMKSISQMEFEKFRIHNGPPLRVHSHEWDRVSAKYPLNEMLLKQIEQDTLQFAVSKARGRVHGFVISNVFYIVWVDPHHNLYPMERHGGLDYCDAPSSCYDCLEIENEELRTRLDELYAEYGRLVDENDRLQSKKDNLEKSS
ncbi:hypothetical protein [Paenibacillus brasilensis]|uniref:Phage protein n=1 Tax=Paenibacillus brasilensis TaxID=128574 RepID=A0ABU0KXW5_9BACL|nr:hypothetical protein [Paenibacillus brasilensis]MDQ0492792.1 hypothetical protein [Paenibacillus brasilensis]